MKKIEPFVNTELLELVREARETTTETASLEQLDAEKARHLSELYRIVSNYEKEELIVCAAAMLEMDDEVYPSVQRAERKSLIKLRKGKKDETD